MRRWQDETLVVALIDTDGLHQGFHACRYHIDVKDDLRARGEREIDLVLGRLKDVDLDTWRGWLARAHRLVIYTDLGISPAMEAVARMAVGIPVAYRTLGRDIETAGPYGPNNGPVAARRAS